MDRQKEKVRGGGGKVLDAILARQSAIVPDSAKLDTQPLPTRDQINNHYDPMDFPIVATACYLRVRGHSLKARQVFDLIRPPTSIFRNVDDGWGRNLFNLSKLFDAGFNRATFEATYPDVKAKVDVAMAALEAAA